MVSASGGGGEFCFSVAVVVGVDGDTGCHEFVDAVQDVGGQGDVGSGELRFELFDGAGSDDRGGDGRVVDDEREGQVDQCLALLLYEQGVEDVSGLTDVGDDADEFVPDARASPLPGSGRP